MLHQAGRLLLPGATPVLRASRLGFGASDGALVDFELNSSYLCVELKRNRGSRALVPEQASADMISAVSQA
jgi:hypothetical protein